MLGLWVLMHTAAPVIGLLCVPGHSFHFLSPTLTKCKSETTSRFILESRVGLKQCVNSSRSSVRKMCTKHSAQANATDSLSLYFVLHIMVVHQCASSSALFVGINLHRHSPYFSWTLRSCDPIWRHRHRANTSLIFLVCLLTTEYD